MSPTDADFGDMHHALGRPAGPHVQPYRNYFCTEAGGALALRFEALGLWEKARTINEGRDAFYRVTDEGRALVWRWLAERNRAKGLRAYRVTGIDLSPEVVMAKSPAAAKYNVYLSADWFSDGMGDFLKRFAPRAVLA